MQVERSISAPPGEQGPGTAHWRPWPPAWRGQGLLLAAVTLTAATRGHQIPTTFSSCDQHVPGPCRWGKTLLWLWSSSSSPQEESPGQGTLDESWWCLLVQSAAVALLLPLQPETDLKLAYFQGLHALKTCNNTENITDSNHR